MLAVKPMDELEKRRCPNLKERLENFYKKPVDEIFVESVPEVDTGIPIGEEIW